MKKKFDFSPAQLDRPPQTISELNAWMTENGCNFQSYQIGSDWIGEGFILANNSGLFTWSYTERGTERVIQSFENEAEAVAYAYEQVAEDGWAWSHMIGFTSSETELESLKAELLEREIDFYDDVIPYGGPQDPRYRVYVHGKHAAQVRDLRQQYDSSVSQRHCSHNSTTSSKGFGKLVQWFSGIIR